MSNRTELRERVREELGDTGTTAIWSDTLLDSLLVEAGVWYSRLFPRQTKAYSDVAAGQRVFSLPEGALNIAGVECPPGNTLPQEAPGPLGAASTTGPASVRQSWSLWGGEVYLARPASGAEVGTQTLVMRLLAGWDRLDPVEPWNGPEEDERLLVLWTAAEAWAWLDGQDRKIGRPGSAGSAGSAGSPGTMAARYTLELEREISARRRAASSRALEVG